MLTTRVFTVTIDVADPINFAAAFEAAALSALRELYEGRCYGGCYVVRVERLLEASPMRIQTTNTSGRATVDLRFEAAVSERGDWDIAVGVKVVSLQPFVLGRLEGEEPLACQVDPSAGTEGLTVGQLLPVRIARITHPPFAAIPTCIALVLTRDPAALVYTVRDERGVSPAAHAPAVAAVRALQARRAALPAPERARLLFFEQLLYAFRLPPAAPDAAEPPALPLPPGAERVDLLALAAGAPPAGGWGGGWTRPLEMHRSEAAAARLAGEPPGTALAVTADEMVAAFLHHVRGFLEGGLQMVETYRDEESFERHRNIWRAMAQAQLPPPAAN